MIYTLLSLIPFIFIIYFFVLSKDKENISFEVQKGLRCYCCKEEILTREEYYYNLLKKTTQNALVEFYDNPTKCLSCKRDDNINSVTGNLVSKLKTPLMLFLISNKVIRFNRTLLFLMVFFIGTDIYMKMTDDNPSRIFFILYVITNLVFWALMVLQRNMFLMKKPAD